MLKIFRPPLIIDPELQSVIANQHHYAEQYWAMSGGVGGNDAQEIHTTTFLDEKMNYIHNNPVKIELDFKSIIFKFRQVIIRAKKGWLKLYLFRPLADDRFAFQRCRLQISNSHAEQYLIISGGALLTYTNF